MASKQDEFFFQNLIAAAESSCKAAEYLVECLKNYDYGNIEGMLEKMHTFEQAGDIKKHEMSAALAKAFVSAVVREEQALIGPNFDETTD